MQYNHKHINAIFTLTEVLKNGSWRGIIVDLSAPSPKLRRPNTETIQKAFQDQWTPTLYAVYATVPDGDPQIQGYNFTEQDAKQWVEENGGGYMTMARCNQYEEKQRDI